MRQVYVCLHCAALYLPPEAMHYPSLNLDASRVHCSDPRCTQEVEATLEAISVSEETMAKWARKAAGLEGEPRRPRWRRAARGRRPGASPGIARSRLL